MTLEECIVSKLKKRKYTIATAESCTGGLLAGRILNVSGASDVFHEGYITYSNQAKIKLLNVKNETLKQFGAVSKETAEEMAKGIAEAADAQVALSVTGVAGPEGGTAEKPVGLIYIGCYINGNITIKECHFSGTREENRTQSVTSALELLNIQLL
ncbi:MAG: CinA family protein [Lachnospiraceae bacterium]